MEICSVMLRVSVFGAALAALSSCATLDEEQCQSINWMELGEQDGAAGRQASHIERHRSACERHELPVDQTTWQAGWERGIRSYCTPENGLVQGREGRSYASSCPAELAPGFEGAYNVAKRFHDARATRDRLENEIRDLERRLRDAEDRDEARQLRRDIAGKDDELRRARFRVREAEREYESYRYANNLAMR